MRITVDITPDDLYELSFLEKHTNFGMKIVQQVKEVLPEKYGELEQFELLCDELHLPHGKVADVRLSEE